MKLPRTVMASGYHQTQWERRYVLHAEVPFYIPAPGGGQFCNTAVCTHDHPDTEEGVVITRECAARLARIINSGRLPDWAKAVNPLPTEVQED